MSGRPPDARIVRFRRAALSAADYLAPLDVNSAPRAVVCLCSSGCDRCEPDPDETPPTAAEENA